MHQVVSAQIPERLFAINMLGSNISACDRMPGACLATMAEAPHMQNELRQSGKDKIGGSDQTIADELVHIMENGYVACRKEGHKFSGYGCTNRRSNLRNSVTL